MNRHCISAVLLALATAALPHAAAAQAMVQAVSGTTDADRLADQMRRLAASPNDMDAILTAGELSLQLGDLSGAASLFARADKIDPHNGRVRAGMGAILVRAERPGEALRYFDQAEGYGLSPASFAADRALAYDLIGQQDRAQRDYRLALRTRADDETIRRYALSLGISGKGQMALDQLAPLLQKSDRGAWRARAFILAMTGRVPEAEQIATTMMPGGMATGLQPFFQRLPTLGAVDRAFAVHFGETRATPERLADARMVPALPVLGPDPYAPREVQVAVAAPVAQPVERRRGRKPRTAPPVQLAAASRAPASAAPVAPAPPPPPALAMVQPLPTPRAARAAPAAGVLSSRDGPGFSGSQPASGVAALRAAPAVTGSLAPHAVASASEAPSVPRTAPAATGFTATAPSIAPRAMPTAAGSLASVTPPATAVQAGTSPAISTAVPATPVSASPAREAVASGTAAAPGFTGEAAMPSVAGPVGTPSAVVLAKAEPVATPVPTAEAVAPSTSPMASAPAEPAPRVLAMPPAASAGHDDAVLARIVASLSIPASELGVTGPVRATVTQPAAVPDAGLAQVRATTALDAAQRQQALDKLAAADKIANDRAAAAKVLAEKRAAEKKAAAAAKAIADRKAAEAEKLAEAKAAAEAKKAARANPERIWVQVAGGANEGDLAKAWAAAKAKAPDVYAGHASGWTTPLRATNRVLAGPFKTGDDARDFVNRLAKKGVSAFTFTSDAGQPVTKLSTP